MSDGVTSDELQLEVERAILGNVPLDDLLSALFTDPPSETVRRHVASVYAKQATDHVQAYCRKTIRSQVWAGNSAFIKCFRAAQVASRVQSAFENDRLGEWKVPQWWSTVEGIDAEQTHSLAVHLINHFHRCCARFLSLDAESAFRQILVEYLTCGEMTREIMQQLIDWKKAGASLQSLKAINWPAPTTRDSFFRRLQDAIKAITVDEFLEQDSLSSILQTLLYNPKFNVQRRGNGVILEVIGQTIFLSDVKSEIEQKLEPKNITEVIIYANDACGIDTSFDSACWRGKNFSISSSKIYVWKKCVIDVSGNGFNSNQTKAANAKDTSENGQNGANGRAGESSGNVALLAQDMVNPSWLSVLLNGGQGERGQHGGDGANGTNGVRVTTQDLENLIVKYGSIYWTDKSHFYNYDPPNCTQTYKRVDTSNEYVYGEYTDNRGRRIYYSLAADKGFWVNTYELYFLIKGTQGTAGSMGGQNGVGGEGGYRGDCLAQNTVTGATFDVRVTRNIGTPGKDGDPGTSGKFGINGNDMALIDRSNKEKSKWPYGEEGHSIIIREYYYDSGKFQRIDGYKKHVEGKSACYMQFTETKLDETTKYAETPQKKTQKATMSKAVCKASIVISEILTKTVQLFKNNETVLSDACKNVNKAVAINEEEEEEQEAEQVQEEVTVIRDRDTHTQALGRYTSEGERRVRAPPNAEQFIQSCKAAWHGTPAMTAQCLFDLFQIELTAEQLKVIRLLLVVYKSRFRRLVEDRMPLAVFAALQSKLANGKSYQEIVDLNNSLAPMIKRKLERAELAKRLRGSFEEYLQQRPDENTDLTKLSNNNTLFGVKGSELPAEWGKYQTVKGVNTVLDKFFSRFKWNAATPELLRHLYQTYKELTRFKDHFAHFKQPDSFNWADENVTAPFLEQFIIEEDDDASSDKSETQSSQSSQSTAPPKPPKIPRIATKLDPHFEEVKTIIGKQANNLNLAMANFKKFIAADEILQKRFGHVPEFHPAEQSGLFNKIKGKITRKKAKMNDKGAAYLIRFYLQTKALLLYQMHLYNCNLLFRKDILHPVADSEHAVSQVPDTENDLGQFMARFRNKPVSVNGDECERYMVKNGLNCAAFRYLLALHADVNLKVYEPIGNSGAARLVESFHETGGGDGENKVMLLCVTKTEDHKSVQLAMEQLVPDGYLQRLAATQEQLCERYKSELKSLTTSKNLESQSLLQFAKFFLPSVRDALIEWLENFSAISENGTLLANLLDRFELDGCHLTLLDFQFILNSITYLQTECGYSTDFVLLIISAIPQNQLVNVMLYLRAENKIKSTIKQIENKEKLAFYQAISNIPRNRLKALFGAKLTSKVDFELIKKLLLMLTHAADGSERLEKIELNEWIDIAERQKWSNIGDLLRAFGSVGYYLAFLDSRERAEEPLVRRAIAQAAFIPEKLIARVTHLIANNEVVANDQYFEELNHILGVMGKTHKHYLKQEVGDTMAEEFPMLNNELNQNNLLKDLEKRYNKAFEIIFPTEERHIDKLRQLIFGMHDMTPEAKQRRSADINRIANLLASKSSENAKLIEKIDNVLFKKKKIRLRDTQKMAVMCAVESDSNVLEQVNTGEGKSFIIATLAIARAQTHKFIDIITSSAVLAQRDAAEMAEIYAEFGISVGHNCDEDVDKRKTAYKAKIVYGDIARFQRDHLLHTFYKRNILGERFRDAVIVDEVDNMVLDNASNMLYLSHSVPGLDLLDSLLIFIHREVHLPVFNGQKARTKDLETQFDSARIKQTVLSDLYGQLQLEDLQDLAADGISKSQTPKVWEKLIQLNIIDLEGYLLIKNDEKLIDIKKSLMSISGQVLAERVIFILRAVLQRERKIRVPSYLHAFVRLHIDELIENCKRALFLQAYEEYVIDVDHTGTAPTLNPVVTIVDKNTGADLATSQWSGGLHQFIQLKHGCRLSAISLKAVFISNVSYLKDYKRINGLSGTLGSFEESKTLVELYDADPIKIPTWKPKNFYEHVPIISTEESEWIKSIYDEARDQVLANRSVLVICKSIAEVQKVKMGLHKHQQMEKCLEMQKTLKSMLVYQREHEEFDMTGEKSLDCRKLIVATNLAGRGTDIKLTVALQNAGGLHVIVSFLPENCRIEEQAYGRAARCGEPGSGQIMALIDQENRAFDSETRPSVFQLKQFRDNAEVHRLQSLKRFYEYHTAIEETCLEAFRAHCNKALEGVYSSSKNMDVDLPSPWQVIYFALLDEWALWLDAKSELIKQCSKSCNDAEKNAIIASVKEFLAAHPMDNYDNAEKWIKAPQSLIALGMIETLYTDAIKMFDRVIRAHPEFAAEAYYYMGCRARGTSNLPYKMWLLLARAHFVNRLERRQEEASIVSRLLHYMGPSQIRVSGFADQQKQIEKVYQTVIANIDWLLGAPCEPDLLEAAGLSEKYAAMVWESLVRQGVISSPVLSMKTLNNHQLEVIRRKFMLSRSVVRKAFDDIQKDKMRSEFDGDIVLTVDVLKHHFKLANRAEFWNELRRMGCLQDEEFLITVNQKHQEGIPLLDTLKPVDITADQDGGQFRIFYSNSHPELAKFYKSEDVMKVFNDNKMELKLRQLVQLKYLEVEQTAIINIDMLHAAGYFNNFDCVRSEDLADFFSIEKVDAEWILQALIDNEILMEQNVLMHRLVKDTKLPEDELVKKTKQLENLDELSGLENISIEVLEHFCKIASSAAEKLHGILEKAGVLDKYIMTVYRLIGTLDCSVLPNCLRNDVNSFLSDRFAYTFAMESLATSIRDSIDDPKTEKVIFLPLDPYKELHETLITCGIIQPPHICKHHAGDLDYEDYDNTSVIRNVIDRGAVHLHEENIELISTVNYLTTQGIDANADTRAFIANGLRRVMGQKEEPSFWTAIIVIALVAIVLLAPVLLVTNVLALPFYATMLAIGAAVVASVGSYQYYRRMRLASRRALNHQQSERDSEFVILREYHSAAEKADERAKMESLIIKAIRDSVGHVTKQLESDLLKNVCKTIRFAGWKADDSVKISEDAMASTLASSPNVKVILDEVRSISQSIAVKCRAAMYDTVKDSVDKSVVNEHKIVLELKKTVVDCVPKIEKEKYVLIQDTIKKFAEDLVEATQKEVDLSVIFADLDENEQTRSSDDDDDDEDQQEDQQENEEVENDENDGKRPSKTTTLGAWKTDLINLISSLIKTEIQRSLYDPTVKTMTNYIHNARTKLKFNEVERQFVKEDCKLKKLIGDGTKQTELKKHTEFLCVDLHRVLDVHLKQERNLHALACIAKFGYPIPIACAPTVANAMDVMLQRHFPNFAGLELRLLNDANNTLLKHTTRATTTLQLSLKSINNTFFITLADYKASLGVAKRVSDDDVTNMALFEEACAKQRDLDRVFPRVHESFRDEMVTVLLQLGAKQFSQNTQWFRDLEVADTTILKKMDDVKV